MQVKIGIRFHRAEITYFKINGLYGYVTMCYWKVNTFSFIPHVCYFSYLSWIVASKDQSLTTLFPTKMGGSHKNINTPPLCKNHKKPKVDNKIQACKTLTLTEGFVFSLCRGSKQSVSCLLTLNWWNTLVGVVAFKFVVETIIHHYHCMLLLKPFI